MEYALTLLAALVAFSSRPGALTGLLLYAGGLSLVAGAVVPASWLSAVLAVVELMVALGALMLWTHYHNQMARIVGLISIVLLCCHFGYSASRGTGPWGVYAWILNVGFGLQCFVAGGGGYGLGRVYDYFRHGSHSLHNAGRRGR